MNKSLMIDKIQNKTVKFLCAVTAVFFLTNTASAQMFIINTDIQYDDNKIIMDADATGGDVTLQFGTDINDYLKFNQTSNLFSFNADVDMQGFEIKDFSIEKLALPPICDGTTKGHLYYNTSPADNNTYACNGTDWEDVTALSSTSSKVVTVGSVNSDYAQIASAAGYLNTLSGGIILLSAETHIINTPVNLRNITLMGKDDTDTTIAISGLGQIDSFDTAFKFLKFDINAITDDMAIDVQAGSSSLYFEWVDVEVQDSGDSLIDSNAVVAPTVVMKFVKSDESGGAGKILKTKALSNLNILSTIFIDSRSTDNALQISDWNAKVTSGGNVNTTGTILPIPADTIIVSPTMNLQGAIDSLETAGRGGLITLLPGTYTINQPLTIEDDNIEISGYGDSTIINATGFAGITDTTGAIQVGAANGTVPRDNVVISDLKLEVRNEIHGIRVAGGSDNRIQNVTVQKMTGASASGTPNARIGIQMIDGTLEQLIRPAVLNSRVFGNQSAGAYFTDGIHVTSDNTYNGVWGYSQGVINVLIDGNNVDYVRETAYAVVGASNSSLFNNRATRMAVAGSGFGIFIAKASSINMNANVFSGSMGASAIGVGIEPFASASAKQTVDCIIDNNVIDGIGTTVGAQGFAVGFMIGNTDVDIGVHRNSFESNAILGASSGVTTAIQVRGNADQNTFSHSDISGGINAWDIGIDLQNVEQQSNKVIINRYSNVTTYLNDAGTSTEVGVVHHRGTVNPTVNDDHNDGYVVGTIWINTALGISYILVDSTAGAAVWNQIDNESGSVNGTDANNFILDQDGTGGNVTLQFGTTITRLFGWDGTNNYVSTFNNQLRFRVLQSAGIPFACAAAVSGTQWMDTDTGIVYVCDTSNGRNKWLAMQDIVMFGENTGACNAGSDIGNSIACAAQWGGSLGPDTGTDLGFYVPYPITITGYGFSEDNDACTSGSFDLEVWGTGSAADDNTYALQTNIATGLADQAHNSNTLNIDVAGNQYVIWGMDNNCGQAIDDWNLVVYYRWRTT